MTIVALLLLFLLNESVLSGSDYRCGSLEIQPCNVNYTFHSRPGFSCDTTRGKACLDRRAWCSVHSGYIENNQCKNSENLMFDRCLSVESTIDKIRYLVNIAQVDWTVAEQFCQSEGMNLVSFKNQDEYDKVIDFVRSIASDPKDIANRHDVKYDDALAQRCWAMKSSLGINIYWSGLFFDRYSNSWNYTDGSPVDKSISSMSETLETALKRHSPATHTGFVGILDKNFNFFLDEISDDHRKIDTLNNRARVLCKGEKNRKWNGSIAKRNSGCITGFKCAGRAPKCITGATFESSDICNGKVDCPHGEDESTEYCNIHTETFPDKNRVVHFYPRKRSVEVTKSICLSGNMSFPSLHSSADIEFLRQLPLNFAKSRRSPDFLLSSEDWTNLNWKILLGINRDSEVWSDGSPIGYLKHEIADLPSKSDIYLVFNVESKGKLMALHDQADQIFPVCQERGFKIVTVPVIVPTQIGTFHTASCSTVASFIVVLRMCS